MMIMALQWRYIWSDNVSVDGGNDDRDNVDDKEEYDDGDINDDDDGEDDDDDGKDGLLAAPSVVLRKYR